jgi:hypothetical protein
METQNHFSILVIFPDVRDCSGATCVYACCNIGRAHIHGKFIFLAQGFAKMGLQVCIGKWKKALCARLHGVRKIFL